jgi:hypothetical protein
MVGVGLAHMFVARRVVLLEVAVVAAKLRRGL